MSTDSFVTGHSPPKESMTATRRFACSLTELKLGSSMTLPGEPAIALFRTESDEIFATADSCTHELWSLGEDSDVEGTELICPLHMARFDLRTGRALGLPATIDLPVYDVERDADGSVYVSIPSD